jgi:hypothetical protein
VDETDAGILRCAQNDKPFVLFVLFLEHRRKGENTVKEKPGSD